MIISVGSISSATAAMPPSTDLLCTCTQGTWGRCHEQQFGALSSHMSSLHLQKRSHHYPR